MEEQRLFITSGANTAYDEFHAAIIDWTSQSNPLAQFETIQFHQLLSDDCSLLVVLECLPLGLGHLEFSHDFSKLGGIDSEVSEEVFLVLINPTEPTEGDDTLNSRHRGD